MRTPQEILADIEPLMAELADAVTRVEIKPGQNLQAALDNGGEVHLVEGGVYPGNFVLKVPGTTLIGHGASLTGSATGPAVDVPPGTQNITIQDVSATTQHDQSVILIGRNDQTQTTLDKVPTGIVLQRVSIPSYRGKCGFNINGIVQVLDCSASDIYDPQLRDSQCLAIENTPGPVSVIGGSFNGATETIMVGGATMSIPGNIPSDLLFQDLQLGRPMSWRTDGIKRSVKNIFELKTGKNVHVSRVTMDGVWKDAQAGYAIVITPRNAGYIQNVLIEDVTVRNCASVCNILGATDVAPATPQPTSGIVLRRLDAVATEELGRTVGSTTASSTGWFAQIGGGAKDVTLENCTFVGDGTTFIATYAGSVVQPDGTKLAGAAMDLLSVTGSTFTSGKYGIMLNGVAYGALNPAAVTQLIVTGNTISGAASAMKTKLPNNTYL